MGRRGLDARGPALVACLAICLMHVGHAYGDGLAMLMVSKSIPPATIAVIDPESGTSSGGSAGTDLRLAPGDVILFRLNYFAMPDRVARGEAGYLTEHIPPNTEVVGIRIIDSAGRTVRPLPPGMALDGCAGGGCGGFNSVPCSGTVPASAAGTACAGGTRNLFDGSIAQVYADTGIFYSTDARTARQPNGAFISYTTGYRMWEEPISAPNIAPILGVSSPFRFHTQWDEDQNLAFGISNSQGNASGNSGGGNTPFMYGSPVAGPLTGYRFEPTDIVADPTLTAWNAADPNDHTGIRFNDAVGPWQRIRYPGSYRGVPSTTVSGSPARTIEDVSTLGFDVTPATPLPMAANAIRVALGELRAGESGTVEVALRVVDTPLDPVQMADVDCAETFGGGSSSDSPGGSGNGGRDNPWGFVIPSPACVFLNNQFDLTVSAPLATGGQTITYTLHGKNLSTLPQTNVVVTQNYDHSRVAFVSATGAPASTTCGGMPCLSWTLGTLDPGEEYTFTTTFTVGGTGSISVVSYANYTSMQLPAPGFTTQAVTLVRATPVLHGDLAVAAGAFATAGGTVAVSGNLRNDGTNQMTIDELTVMLPTGFTLAPSSVTISGTAYAATATGSNFRAAPSITLAAGATRPISFVVRAPAGAATGLYPLDLSVWGGATGYGGSFETLFDDVVMIPVGAPRSATPALDCPIFSNATTFGGTTSEADGTDVRAYLGGIQRAIDTNALAGRFTAGTVGPGSPFGRLYGGLEVTATAQAPGELESLPSAPCFVTHVAACSDGFDNDGDGVVDFPTDPGCSSPTDNDERNVQCSDGLDNDGDGLVDWPADFECSSLDDNAEAGTPACGNGVDDDGDGRTDFPMDTGCTSATDRDEIDRRRCSNGLDDDGDGRIDFGTAGTNDPGCHSANDDDERNFAYAPGDVRPRLLLVFDTSGSMNWNVCTDVFTGGDGSMECAGSDVSCATCPRGGNCGDMMANDSRIALARAGVGDVVAGFGDVELGLMRFRQRATSFSCPTTNASAQSGGWAGSGSVAGSCGSFAAGDLLVGFSPENEYSMLEYVDGDDNYGGTAPPGLDIELRGSGTTPLAGSLDSARTFLTGVRGADAQAMCRPYRVILLTDGTETCGGNPVASATALQAAGYPVYVIGFATRAESAAQLNAIAAAGGTTSAIFADDRVTLAAAIADIVNDSILIETCNGADDDCDGEIDEGFVLYCNRPTVTTMSLCTDPGETICNGVDDNCDGRIDEGLRNLCGTCGPVSAEVCNGVDDDCDGIPDEGPSGVPGSICAGCSPMAELCDDDDDDCDGRIDEGIVRGCGTDVGACTLGTQTCVAGSFGACTGTGPTTETCNDVDDDCDGVIDGLTRPCGTDVGACQAGTETCTAGTFGSCIGSIGPSMELCNLVDDDCDASVDDGNPGGGGTCGTSIGECDFGSLVCMAGTLTCTGGRGPAPELCNALDDDCDGATDEAIPPGAACGACGDGRQRCVAGMMTCTGDRTPGTEVCNGVDDDCDGTIDDGNPGGGAACGTSEGECAPGTTICRGGRIECDGSTGPTPEACDTEDDDCDGLVDEGNPGGGGACGMTGAGECELGSQVCVGGTLTCVGESGPRPERCDGLDNDCDSMIDEGDPGGGVACGDDTGECRAGVTLCTGGTLVCDGAIGPSEEVCDTLDNDCDGVPDDGLSLGAPCGSDVGECVPGVLVCMDGAIVCDGAIGPASESCNALDDDCDTAVDEELPLGGTCGMSVGACVPGMLQCVDGRQICVGEVPSGPEICDCDDDDCDTAVDEGELCGSGNRCLDCSCAQPCTGSEFMPCPEGTVPTEQSDGTCFCETPRCMDEECGASTQMAGTDVTCMPDADGVSYADELPVCVCNNNTCTTPCEGVVCAEGLVCNPHSGLCTTDDCGGLGCPMGEICDLVTRECTADPCATAGCAADQACRMGVCETSCADLTCDAGERCEHGACVEDLCEGIAGCVPPRVCDPDTGDCVDDMCFGVSCMSGTRCDRVTGTCERDACLDLRCPDGERCVAGECEDIPLPPDAGPPIDSGPRPDVGMRDAGPPEDPDPYVRVLAAGGGGCLCSTPGTTGSRSVPATLVLLALLGVVLVGRRAIVIRRAR